MRLLALLFLCACTRPSPVDGKDSESLPSDDSAADDSARDDSATDDSATDDSATDDSATDDSATVDPCDDLAAAFTPVTDPPASPPYSGTVWFDANILTPSDPSSYTGLTATGQGSRTMYDRRSASWVTLDAWLFEARFSASTTVEVQVNPELSQSEAQAEAERYAEVIGRLPGFFFAELETVWIHRGDEAFGGGNNNLLIHTDRGETHAIDGVLEEVFLHEATHTSLDAAHREAPLWQAAQQADGVSISTYGRDNPSREDLAETVGPWIASRFAAQRVDAGALAILEQTVPNRLLYLDCQGLTLDAPP